MLRVYLVCLGPFRTTGSHPLIWLSLTGSPGQRTCLLHNRPLSQQPGKHISIFISIPSILGKNLTISLDQTPVEGGEPAGSFCNLSLTWIQKTKVILSAAETQLPFMLPPGLWSRLLTSTEAPLSWWGTVASLPEPLLASRCAWRSLWTCPAHTGSFFSGSCSFGAARLVAWLAGTIRAKAQDRSSPASPSFWPRSVAAQNRSSSCGLQGSRRCTRRRLSHLSKQPASRKLS